MWHKPCRTFHPWCLCIKTRCLLTHCGRVTHICVSTLTIIGSEDGLAPDRRQTIIWTNDGILLIGPLGTNFSEILMEIYTCSIGILHLKMSSEKWQPFCLNFNVFTVHEVITKQNTAKLCAYCVGFTFHFFSYRTHSENKPILTKHINDPMRMYSTRTINVILSWNKCIKQQGMESYAKIILQK